MRLQKILSRLQKLHPKEIDLSLDRIKHLLHKLGNPQNKIKAITVVGTNGKNSTINAIFSILKSANIKCNVYTSPHILKINERFIFDNVEIKDEELGFTETNVLSDFFFLKTTVPLTTENIEWSFPIFTFSPGKIFVPLCRMMILPGSTIWPPYFFTPNLLPALSLPFLDDPPAFFVAITYLTYFQSLFFDLYFFRYSKSFY